VCSSNEASDGGMGGKAQAVNPRQGAKVLDVFQIARWITQITWLAKADWKRKYSSTSLEETL
jgi:hypothetical protein